MSAAIFTTTAVKILRSILDLNEGAQIHSGTVTPSSSAVSANRGSLYLNTSTGAVFRKTDNGSSTNWVVLGTLNIGDTISSSNPGTVFYAGALGAFSETAVGTSGRILVSGGTGSPTWFAGSPGAVFYAGASGVLAESAVGTSGRSLVSGGTGAPTWFNGSPGAVRYSGASGVLAETAVGTTGRILVSGGTGSPTWFAGSAGAVFYAGASGVLAESAVGTTGRALISGGTGSPTWYAPTAGGLLYAGTSGVLASDNTLLNWDGTRLLINQTAQNFALDSETLQVSASGSDGGATLVCWSGGSTQGAWLSFSKNAGNTIGTKVATASGETIGGLKWRAMDVTTTGNFRSAASIICTVDGVPGASVMPGKISIRTSPTSSATPVERATIDSGGKWIFGASGSPPGPHEFHNNSTGQDTLIVKNDDLTTNSDDNYNLRLVKGSTTNTTSQCFVLFHINNGGTASGSITANGANAATFTSTSDERVKRNIKPLNDELSNIMALNPCEFDYIKNKEAGTSKGHNEGFVAQEMKKIYPDAVSKDRNGFLQISGWSKTEARMVRAMQQMQEQIDMLRAVLAV